MSPVWTHSLVCLGEYIAVLQVQNAVLGRGRLPRWGSFTAALCLWGILQWFWGDYTPFSLESVLFNGARFFGSTFLFGGQLYQKFNALLLSGVTILFYENILGAYTSAFYDIPMEQIWRVPNAVLLYLLVLNGLVFGVLRLLRRYTHAISRSQKTLGTLYLCIVGLLNLLLMQFGRFSRAYNYMFLISLGLVLSSAFCFAGFVMLSSQVQRAAESLHQNRVEQERAEVLMESYQTQRRLTHEFTNHLGALSIYLGQEDLEGARKYLSNLTQDIASVNTVVNTHNPFLDTLLSREYRAARDAGVILSFDLCDLSRLPLSGTELVTLTCNLLDNAIAAARCADPPQVELRARPAEHGFVLSVRNRVAQDVRLSEGSLPPSTKDEPGHGIGLRNVQQVVQRRGGEFSLSCRDRWFCFTCILPEEETADLAAE